MKEQINDKLEKIEKEYDVDVLSARDFGSTAWNLDGPESDRDVAFIFKQNELDYAKIDRYKESIDRMFEIEGKEHSFMGWNLKRFMELMDGSNPTTIEFLHSPISYKSMDDYELIEELKDHAADQFKPISIFYHYRSLAKDNYNQYIKNENHKTVKRYIYVLRALLYARYVEETHRMPNLDFPEFLSDARNELVKKGIVPERIVKEAEKLAGMKKNGKGSTAYSNPYTEEWIENELDNKLDNEEHDVRGIDTDLLNNKMEEILDE